MALHFTPSSTQNDFNTLVFNQSGASEDIALLHHRTLAPEWYPQSGVQLTWPHAETDWAYMLEEVTACYLRLAYEIAIREPLLIVAPDTESVRKLLEEKLPQRATQNIRYFSCPTNDTWARDHAFLRL